MPCQLQTSTMLKLRAHALLPLLFKNPIVCCFVFGNFPFSIIEVAWIQKLSQIRMRTRTNSEISSTVLKRCVGMHACGRNLTYEQADYLISSAEAIINAIGRQPKEIDHIYLSISLFFCKSVTSDHIMCARNMSFSF